MEKEGVSSAGWIVGLILIVSISVAILCVVSPSLLNDNNSNINSASQDELAKLLTTDPELILYKEEKPVINTGFEKARVIAVDANDQIYVTGDQSVRAYDASGKALPFTIQLDKEISALSIADDGTLYVGVSDHVEVFDANGQRKSVWETLEPKSIVSSIGIAGENVFLADAGARTIHHFKTDGTKQKDFGEFVLPSFYFDLAVADENRLKVAHTGKHRLETYDFDGNLLSWWGEFSMKEIEKFCGCCNPVNFALLPDQQGYVTCEKGITRVKQYSNNGNFLGVVAGPEQFTKHDLQCDRPDACFNPIGLDVAVDSQGRVLVLDSTTKEIRIFVKKTDQEIVG